MLGRLYAQPEPGAAPFVALGSVVTEASQFIEYGQVLFRVRPEETRGG